MHKRRVAIALNMAASWHSDQDDGIAMLSLSSTRTIHSEEHRQKSLKEIDAVILITEQWIKEGDADAKKQDVITLKDLRVLVTEAVIGQPWISDRDYMRLDREIFESQK